MKNKKIPVLCAFIVLLALSPAFSFELQDLQDTADEFSAALVQSIPFNSTLGLNWSDAYIGQFLNVPPHFGIGLSAGFTTLKMDPINKLLEYFKYEIPIDSQIGFLFPACTLEARIGGFFLPFDIGAKFGYLNTAEIDLFNSFGVNIDYLLIGADIRFALIDKKVLPLKLSIGVGFNYLKGGLSTTIENSGTSYSFKNPLNQTEYKISTSDLDLGLLWQASVLELKAHVSFPVFIITPYAGVGVSYSWAKTGYQVKSKITATEGGAPINLDDVYSILNGYGLSGISDQGFESLTDVSDWNVRVYGGLSMNLTAIKLDFTMMYNIRDSAIGGTFGIRFQL